MWLLNTSHPPGPDSLEYKLDLGGITEYAILSHTWDDDEVTFDDMQPGGDAKKKKGYAKLHNAVKLAQIQGYKYIWIDTCCIDKKSSAELSESINSMFAWYRDAAVCYAYIADVNNLNMSFPKDFDLLRDAKWFKRGWTLQELLAPKEVIFYDGLWETFGTRRGMAPLLQKITGIPQDILAGHKSLDSASAAMKMSWAAKRVTKRPEDIAYCLLGLFDVNMPLLYGEGAEKAFVRLQHEFLKASEDESIFAWWAPKAESRARSCWSLLSPTPRYFADSSDIRWLGRSRPGNIPIEVTNRGLRIETSLDRMQGDRSESLYFCKLQCYSERETHASPVAIILQSFSPAGNYFTRSVPHVRLTRWWLSFYKTSLKNFSERFLKEMGPDVNHQEMSVKFRIPIDSDPGRLIFIQARRPPEPKVQFASAPELVLKDDFEGRVFQREWSAQPYNSLEHSFHEILARPTLVIPNMPSGTRAMSYSTTWSFTLEYTPNKENDRDNAWQKTFHMILGSEQLPDTPFGSPAPWSRPLHSFRPPEGWRSLNGCIEGRTTLQLPNGLTLDAEITPRYHPESGSYDVALLVSKSDQGDTGSIVLISLP